MRGEIININKKVMLKVTNNKKGKAGTTLPLIFC
jgi:hypothetical protein